MAVHGLDKLLRDLNDLERNFERRSDDFPYEIKTSIIRQIVRGGHIKTTRMIRAMDYHRSAVVDGSHRFTVDTSNNPDVFYDGWLEFVRRNWRGAYVYQKGIENADIQGVADRIVSDSFVI